MSTGFVRKSHDQSIEECRFRNCSHVDSDRSGDGSMPYSLRMFWVVVRETDIIPSLRISALVRGLPARFFGFLCLGARSQFWNVLNCTMEMRCRSSSPTALPNRIRFRLAFGVRDIRLGSFDRRRCLSTPSRVSHLISQSVATCRFRNQSQIGSTRSGAGFFRCCLRIFRTVVLDIDMIPSLRTPPRIRVCPLLGVLSSGD